MNSRMINKKVKKKRKRKILKRILLLVSVLFITLAGYTGFQYYQGTKEAGATKLPDNKDIEFNGEEDQLGKVNVLLLGVDSRGEEQSRTDTIMIAQYDPETGESKLVSLMRDMYVEIPGYQNYKINTAYFLGGPELLRKTIKHNFDIDIQYYAIIDFKGFEKSVDTLAPNGIEMEVEKRISGKEIGVTIEPGTQALDGQELLGYARFRKDAEGDFGRVRRQQEVLNALMDELVSVHGVTKIPRMLGNVKPYFETNMGSIKQTSIIKDLLLNSKSGIQTMTIPVEGSYWDNRYEHAGAVLEIDTAKNKEELEGFLEGNVSEKAEETDSAATDE